MLTVRLQQAPIASRQPTKPTLNAPKDTLCFVPNLAHQFVITLRCPRQRLIPVGFALYNAS
jgi:hypothetical protein